MWKIILADGDKFDDFQRLEILHSVIYETDLLDQLIEDIRNLIAKNPYNIDIATIPDILTPEDKKLNIINKLRTTAEQIIGQHELTETFPDEIDEYLEKILLPTTIQLILPTKNELNQYYEKTLNKLADELTELSTINTIDPKTAKDIEAKLELIGGLCTEVITEGETILAKLNSPSTENMDVSPFSTTLVELVKQAKEIINIVIKELKHYEEHNTFQRADEIVTKLLPVAYKLRASIFDLRRMVDKAIKEATS